MSDGLMDAARVEALISELCSAVQASGANLLEAHQALKSVDAVIRQQLREAAVRETDAAAREYLGSVADEPAE